MPNFTEYPFPNILMLIATILLGGWFVSTGTKRKDKAEQFNELMRNHQALDKLLDGSLRLTDNEKATLEVMALHLEEQTEEITHREILI